MSTESIKNQGLGASRQKIPGLRLPKTPTNAERGVGMDVDLNPPQPEFPEDLIKKFGPCQIQISQAKTAILLLQSPETSVVLEALNCLQKFCKKGNENKRLFIDENGLLEAKKLMFNENNVIQRFAMKLMAIASSFHEAALQLKDLEIAPDLVVLTASPDEVLVEYSTFVMSSLATLPSGRAQVVHSNAVLLLIQLLGHEDPDIQKNAAETIWRLLEEPSNIDLIISKEFIEPILKLINAEYPALQIVALSILEKVSTRDPGVEVLEGVDAIQQLGEKLAMPEYGDLHRVILRTLTNMCTKPSARQKIVQLVPVAARVLDTSPDVTAQVYALGLLGVLSSIPHVAKGLVDFGMCRRLLKILTSSDTLKLKEAAAFCVTQLSKTDARAREEFLDAIQPLLALSEAKVSDSGFEYTWMALATLLEDGYQACPIFVNQNGLGVIRRILENHWNYSNAGLISVMTCVNLLAGNWNLRNYCIEAGLVPLLLNVTKSNKNPEVLTAAANALSGLLCLEKGREEFMDNGGYDLLVGLVSHVEGPVVISAVPLIQTLGTYQEITKVLIEQGILQVIWKRHDLICKNGPLRTAFERLLSSYLPAKYSISGYIDPFEKLNEGFYDFGNLKGTDTFLTLDQMSWEERDPQRHVLFLNWTGAINYKTALENNSALQLMQEENQNCQSLVEAVEKELSQLEVRSNKELVKMIAKAVSDRMGGVMDKWRVSAKKEDLEVADLQVKYNSVVVPITMISNGAFRCRALLFKALCDVFGIPCSLERGEYKRTWNVVLLQSKYPLRPCGEGEEPKSLVLPEELHRFVVDLVYQPGTILPVNSYDANTYCFV